jgi:hypothetical protein
MEPWAAARYAQAGVMPTMRGRWHELVDGTALDYALRIAGGASTTIRLLREFGSGR